MYAERHRQAACAVSGTFFEGYLNQPTATQHSSSSLDSADLFKVFYYSQCLMNGEWSFVYVCERELTLFTEIW
jgi:hypothetical protein